MRKEEVGNRYGALVVTEYSHSDANFSFWVCKCDCGGTKITRGHTLRNGKCKSCGACGLSRLQAAKDKPQRLAYKSYKLGAKNRGLPFSITYDTFLELTEKPCHLCGRKPYERKYGFTRKRYSIGVHADVSSVFNGLDRLDSELGYIDGNVAACCAMCNRMKSDFCLDTFLEKVVEIYKNMEAHHESQDNCSKD